MALKRTAAALFGILALAGLPAGARAAEGDAAPPAPTAAGKDEALVYIFSGVLTGDGETYSGTLIAGADGPQFELKLGRGATCDGNKLEPDKGLLRLPETPCSDSRPLKALFVYQEGGFLRVYGTLGGERFATLAHALPADAVPPEAKKSAAPPADLMNK